jgi:hypothetical protein
VRFFRKEGEEMDEPRSCTESGEREEILTPPASVEVAGEQPAAWEQVENGRYMPRRIRGSCLGRELG